MCIRDSNDTTCHQDARSTTFITVGDSTTAATVTDARPVYSWCFVKGIDVSTSDPKAAAIVASVSYTHLPIKLPKFSLQL